MANLKEVRNRIASVKSTQQITKAMKMVSAAKLRKATDRIIQMRPYADKLSGILKNLLASAEDISLDFATEREAKNVLIILITSDRGLCGGFNSNLVKTAIRTIKENYSDQAAKGNVSVLTVGKKGLDHFKRTQHNINSDYVELFGKLNFEDAAEAANHVMEGYSAGTYDRVELIYSRFKNAGTQIFQVDQYLPVDLTPANEASSPTNLDMIYEPSQQRIVEELVPLILRTQFFKALLESNASEHGARMTAMDKASENANEMLKELKLSYNRARQAAITTELIEIVSGANALKG